MKMMLTAAAGLCAAGAIVAMAGFGQPGKKDPPQTSPPAAVEPTKEPGVKKAQPGKVEPKGAEPAAVDPPGLVDAAGAGEEGSGPLSKLAWLAGTWQGSMYGDPVEEIWSAPRDDSQMGMFRWQAKGKTTMWEMLAVTVVDDKPALRLRHFDAKFEPWKGECESIVTLPATTVEKARVVFTNSTDKGGLAACEYECTDPNTLHVTVSFKDAKREALRFEMRRKIQKQW